MTGLFLKCREKKSAIAQSHAEGETVNSAGNGMCDNSSFRFCRETEFGPAAYATRRTAFSVSIVRPTSAAGQGLPK